MLQLGIGLQARPQTRVQVQRELQRTYAAVEYQGYLEGLKQAADIVIYSDKL
jgi:hypothetical protein